MTENEHIQAKAAGEQGMALLMGLFLVIFSLGITISGSIFINSNRTSVEVRFVLHGQATQFARSGLTEALNWMRRQSSQPVVAFAPVRDTGAVPPILDTEDPDIGLVRSFSISGTKWGRYEVWKEWGADPDSTRHPYRQLMQARDVSSERGQAAVGRTWLIKAVGYVYDQRDPNRAYDELPNRVLAQETLEMEVSRLSFSLPGQAAVNAADGGSVSVPNGTEILGGGTAAGVYYASGSGTPSVTGGTVTGVPPLSPAVTFDGSPEKVFGMSEAGLREMADMVITVASTFPRPVPTGSLIFVDTAMTFTSTFPLTGNGIVYFKEDVQSTAGNTSLFNGIVYTNRDLTLLGPCEIRGSMLSMGALTLSSSGGLVTVVYDQAVVDTLQTSFGAYRPSRKIRMVHAY